MDNLKFTNIGMILFMIIGMFGLIFNQSFLLRLGFAMQSVSIIHLWSMKYLKFNLK